MSSLGSDIIFGEILPKLPVKSLMRFKSVSKTFLALISSRQFIQLLLRRYSIYSDDLLVIPKDGSIICYGLNSPTPVATFTWNDRGSLSIMGSCNGLLCIFPPNAYTQCTLFNPTSRISKIVDISDIYGTRCSHGFAFDSVNQDFKIVGISDKCNGDGTNRRITKVYCVNTGSIMILDSQVPTQSMDGSQNGVLVNNNLLHWMFRSPCLRIRRIGCFDVCKMDWTDDVLLPHQYYDQTHRNFLLDIGELDGLFCSTFENKDDACFDVWVMIEYGVQDSWFKLFSIPFSESLPNGAIPVASRSGVEVLLLQRFSSKFYWYNMADGQMSDTVFDKGLYAWPKLKRICAAEAWLNFLVAHYFRILRNSRGNNVRLRKYVMFFAFVMEVSTGLLFRNLGYVVSTM